jgi:biopolymer transport protein ExbD
VTIKVALPPASAKPARKPPKIIYLSIKKDGRIFVGDDASDLDTLGDDLVKAVGNANRSNERIFIRGDQDVLYENFMAVMNKLQDNGFYSVALVGEDKSGLK